MKLKQWVLHSGNEYFFAYWTVTGPKFTTDIQEAQVFESEEEAKNESNKHWALTVYEPLEVLFDPIFKFKGQEVKW